MEIASMKKSHSEKDAETINMTGQSVKLTNEFRSQRLAEFDCIAD